MQRKVGAEGIKNNIDSLRNFVLTDDSIADMNFSLSNIKTDINNITGNPTLTITDLIAEIEEVDTGVDALSENDGDETKSNFMRFEESKDFSEHKIDDNYLMTSIKTSPTLSTNEPQKSKLKEESLSKIEEDKNFEVIDINEELLMVTTEMEKKSTQEEIINFKNEIQIEKQISIENNQEIEERKDLTPDEIFEQELSK